MSLDLPTSLAVTVFASAVAGCLLLMSWLHHRKVMALVFWGFAFVMAAVAVALIAARGNIPDIWSIAAANVILAIAYGAMWSGARSFEGRSIRVFAALAGALIWLLASISSAFYDTPTARATLTAAIGITYTLLTARELWRARGDTLVSRLPIIILLLLHAASLPARIPLVGTIAHTEPVRTNLLAFVMFESVSLCMAAAYLFGSIVKERVALWYRQASLIDPLTGVANRRAFLKQGARLLRRSTSVNRQHRSALVRSRSLQGHQRPLRTCSRRWGAGRLLPGGDGRVETDGFPGAHGRRGVRVPASRYLAAERSRGRRAHTRRVCAEGARARPAAAVGDDKRRGSGNG